MLILSIAIASLNSYLIQALGRPELYQLYDEEPVAFPSIVFSGVEPPLAVTDLTYLDRFSFKAFWEVIGEYILSFF